MSRKTQRQKKSAPAAEWPLRLEWRSPAELEENPANWRRHPDAQITALGDVIAEVGWAGVVLFNERTQRIIDGHARKKVALQQGMDRVPVLVGDWTEEQERLILATFDPLGALAETDKPKLDALMTSLATQSQSIKTMLANHAAETAPPAKKPDAPDLSAAIDEKYAVFLECASERDQGAIITELARHGLNPRAMTIPRLRREDVEPPEPPAIAATAKRIVRESKIDRSPRVVQIEGIFDLSPARKSKREWIVDLDLNFPWQIGLIVGPSGSGKSTLASELFGKSLVAGWPWPDNKAIVDGFPARMLPSEITGLLSSVGLSSPPSWLKPFRVLSNGEQFRVNLARTLAEAPDLAVVDEFTSVVDRTVARIGSAAVAKAIRSTGRRFVAVGCHYDVVDWLQPDWILEMPNAEFRRRSLRRRPDVQLSIRRVGTDCWPRFGEHHYLSTNLHRAAACFLAEVEGQPAALVAVLHSVGRASFWREHRCVCLPDFQGVGIGNALSEFVASMYVAKNKPYRSTTSHPAMIAHRCRSPLWALRRKPSLTAPSDSADTRQIGNLTSRSIDRLTAGFQYIGPGRPEDAKRLGVI